MTDIEKKALALLNEACRADFKDLGLTYRNNLLDALLLAIEQHEAFRQEVSDALKGQFIGGIPDKVARFIIAKPDPLAECLLELELSEDEQEARHDAEWLVKTIEKRGGKIVWGEG